MPTRDTLYEQIALRLRERWLLLDVDWVCELAIDCGVPATRGAIDQVVDEALQRERDAHERGERPADVERDRYRFWTDVFQLELADARRAAVTFNSLDAHTRRVFFALIIQERSVKECVQVGLGDREALGAMVNSALRYVLNRRCRPVDDESTSFQTARPRRT